MHVDAIHVASRFGPLSAVADMNGVVIGASFQPLDVLVAKLIGIYGVLDVSVRTRSPILDAVTAYDNGECDAYQALKVRQPGGVFLQRVWAALRTVSGGQVVTYAGLAHLAGSPKAARAAGTACSGNLVAPFVPCHRVVRAGGQLGNYGFGADLKRRLLEHEAFSAQARQ